MLPRSEGRLILQTLKRQLPSKWDGRKCVLELKKADSNWRQTEWIGWWYEWKARSLLIAKIGGSRGPIYGRTTIDYVREHAWDLKAHPASVGRRWAILNDSEAVDACIANRGGIGFVIACGEAEYDDPAKRPFQKWHTALYGGESGYTRKRKAEGRPSRRRKRAFRLNCMTGFYISSRKEAKKGIGEGWLKDTMQAGWRNSNGSPRRAKYAVRVAEIPDWARLPSA